MMYVVALIALPGLLVGSVVNSEMSKEVGPITTHFSAILIADDNVHQVHSDAQGKLQGGIGSLNIVAQTLGGLTCGGLFAYFVSDNAVTYLPGAPFFFGGFCQLIGLLFILHAQQLPPEQGGTSPEPVDPVPMTQRPPILEAATMDGSLR